MMPIQLSPGDIFGRWTVLETEPVRIGEKRKWLCRCVCGSEGMVATSDLTKGHSTSCGCYSKERRKAANTKHGHAQRGVKTPVYLVWEAMTKRCHLPTDPAFHNYGGRGIKVCDAWSGDFSQFLRDMGEPIPGQSIERGNVNGNYEPNNCFWATRIEQMNNKRSNVMLATVDGVMTVSEFARRNFLNYERIQKQVKRGITEIAGIKFRVAGRRDSMQPPPAEEIIEVLARKFNVEPHIAKRWLVKFNAGACAAQLGIGI